MTDASAKPRTAAAGPIMRDRIVSALLIGIIRLLCLLPYHWRVPASGWIMSRVLAPLMGHRRRIRDNLALIFPDMPEAQKAQLVRRVPNQLGRTLIEMFSPQDLRRVAAETRITGEGLAAMEAARARGRPVIMVSGHFGNYDIGRSALMQRGFDVGALYRPMNNERVNAFYVSRILQIGTPLFRRGRRGMAEMLKFLRQGNCVAILIDQHMAAGEKLTFFGQPAYTALSAAEMALKYDALLVPGYGIRRPDGLSFEVILEAPIPHTSAAEMTQRLNDSLEAQVRAHMDQWLWVHRRWKSVAGD
jgi:KDO2-lipid IV(A) lauroyltransferase